jgi:hypothetical protein
MLLRGWTWAAAIGPAGLGERPLLAALAAAIPEAAVAAAPHPARRHAEAEPVPAQTPATATHDQRPTSPGHPIRPNSLALMLLVVGLARLPSDRSQASHEDAPPGTAP